jgi:exopolysaccharide biosynthesis predicted pyruvyltransferase EpsI
MHQRVTGDAIVGGLRSFVGDTLRTLIPAETPCALIDFPDHPNVGDSAIWLGERAALNWFGVPILYTCSTRTYAQAELRSRLRHGTILIHGGGNLGDLWPDHEALREAVIRDFPHNKIIQLPQTVWFRGADNLARARTVFNAHPDLTILARDQRSLNWRGANSRSPACCVLTRPSLLGRCAGHALPAAISSGCCAMTSSRGCPKQVRQMERWTGWKSPNPRA